jgi:sterol desaturase/sphingolipid hydroxylase (fatty acid hydroxylase superfamily)
MNNFEIFILFYIWFIFVYILNTSIHVFFDISYYDISQKYKITQISKNEMTELYKRYYKRVLFNVLVIPIIWGLFGIYFFDFTFLFENEFNFVRCLCDLITIIIVQEIIFYCFHRLLHLPMFYRIHKLHHHIKHPIALASLYAHPVDAILGIFVPFG